MEYTFNEFESIIMIYKGIPLRTTSKVKQLDYRSKKKIK